MLRRLLLVLVTALLVSSQAFASTSLPRKGINVPAFVHVDRGSRDQGVESIFLYRDHRYFTEPGFVAKLRGAGIELVRVVVNPLPLIYGPIERRHAAAGEVVQYIKRLNVAGIFGIVDLHFWSPDPTEGIGAIFRDEAILERYRQALRLLAVELSAAIAQGGAALELLNEPPACPGRNPSEWTALQPKLVAEIRSIAPTLPLVVTGCVGGIDALLEMPGIAFDDPNLYFSFHFYEPFLFTHQNIYYLKGLEAIPYPPKPEGYEAAIAGLSKIDTPDAWRTIALDRWGGSTRLSKRRYLEREISRYLNDDEGRRSIEARFDEVTAWATRHRISPHRILIGEFGVTFRGLENPEPLRASKLSWVRDVRETADRHGFAYAYWLFPKPGTFDNDGRTGFIRADLASALGFGNAAD